MAAAVRHRSGARWLQKLLYFLLFAFSGASADIRRTTLHSASQVITHNISRAGTTQLPSYTNYILAAGGRRRYEPHNARLEQS
ncbi:hypothetical protein EDC01DRAFT_646121 [Geopyxis carbonaria]|nr:hypothetical protein EDC01DRAFT_646121 [Geopyxis carbonaria]